MLPRTADRISFFIKRSRSTFLVTSPMISSGSVADRNWPSHSGTSGGAGSGGGGVSPSSEPPSSATGASETPGEGATGSVALRREREEREVERPFAADESGAGWGDSSSSRRSGCVERRRSIVISTIYLS